MISINRVRNTVFYLLNKSNRGTIGAGEFDAFCNLAQADLFENLFYRYNKWVNNSTKRYSNTEHADMVSNLEQQINTFATYSTDSNFTYNITNNVWSYIGNDLYRTEGISLINSQGRKQDIDEVLKGYELNNAINSKINPPSLSYPIYTKIGNSYRVYPTVPIGYSVELLYIRSPKQVKWTYILDSSLNPQYSASASDKQDFELDEVLFPLLVAKILSYCGLSIKETEVVAAAEQSSQLTEQKEQ